MLTSVEIQIWSDVICPWCYIGTTNLRAALKDTDARIVFRSFLLDPSGPSQPVRTLEYLTSKFGPQAEQMMEHVTEVAAKAGLEYHLDRSWSGPTLTAHRLLHWADSLGLQDTLAQRFFAAQFTEGRSLFDPDSLVALCQESGLDPVAARSTLDSDAYAESVADDLDQARRYGISGVPFFVFNDRLAVSGAQPPEVFTQALAQA